MVRLKLIRAVLLAGLASVAVAASSAGAPPKGVAAAAAQAASAGVSETAAVRAPPPPSAVDLMRLRDGMAAISARDWAGVSMQRDSATDPVVRKLLQWRVAVETDSPLSFEQMADALSDLGGWPGREAMRTRAEQMIFASRLTPEQRIAFLRQDDGPISGDGRAALALALASSGRASEAEPIARAVWREDRLTAEAESALYARFGDDFSAEDHAARVDILIWRGERSAAQRLFPRISSADRLLATARIALQVRQRRGLQAAVDAVPASRRDNPGLLYDRARYIRRSGRPEDALPVAARIDPNEAPLAARDEIFDERRLYLSRALRAGNHRTAFNLVANHGLTRGEEFAEAEWLAGWIALRFLNNPQEAATRFAHLDSNVSSPVSSSRALYWRAQAAKALGDRAAADQFLASAARLNFTYYGQLAAAERGDAYLSLAPTANVPQDARLRFENRELVRALRAISDIGTQRDFERIAYHLDDALADPAEIELLSQMAREKAYPRTALRSAKAGLFRGVVATEAAYPLIDLPSSVRRPEPALVLAIIRQESEFDPRAISSANARGLMQLIPSTARLQARSEGMTYQLAALTNDPQYNMTLGAAHLGDLVDNFNGSYVLAIASYNAGSSRAREWIADWGDPRARSTDVVDWVELIPFSETRNYVQRVMENLQVYRHRLSGEPTRITIEQDLRRGG